MILIWDFCLFMLRAHIKRGVNSWYCPPMVYSIPHLSIFIYLSVSITSNTWFLLRCWQSIIFDFIPILQKIIYILSSRCMHRSLMLIIFNHHLPFVLLLFDIFEHMWIRSFCIHYNPPLNAVQLFLFKVLMFHEN